MILRNDKLSKLLDDCTHNSRRDNWLWVYLATQQLAQYHVSTLNKRTMRDTIANTLVANSIDPQQLLSILEANLIPENLLAWIIEDKRQYEWMKSRIWQNYSNLIPESLNYRERTLLLIDNWYINYKANEVEKLKKGWLEQLKKDKRLDWIKEKDEYEACNYIWDWVIKNKFDQAGSPKQPIDHQTTLLFFDSSGMTDVEKKTCIDSAKKAWRQKIRRTTQKDKKQQNFILTEKAIRRLDKLSKKHELPRAQIIEILLMIEQEKGLYIAERFRILSEPDS